MTAKEFISEQHEGAKWEKILIDFASYHVEQALFEASKKASEYYPYSDLQYEFFKLYPLKKIK